MKKLKASLQITINFLQELLCLYFIVGELKVFTCSSAVLCLALGTVTWTLDKRFPFDLIANNANIFSTARTQTVHSTFIHIYWRRKVGFLYQLFSNDSPISGPWKQGVQKETSDTKWANYLYIQIYIWKQHKIRAIESFTKFLFETLLQRLYYGCFHWNSIKFPRSFLKILLVKFQDSQSNDK